MGYTIFFLTNILNNQNKILICNKIDYQPSVSIFWSCMFFQMLKMVAWSIVSTSSLAYCASGFWLHFIWKILFQIAILSGMIVIFLCQICISLGQFVCHSKLLPHMRQASNIILFSHSCRSVSVNSLSSPLHVSLSSSAY